MIRIKTGIGADEIKAVTEIFFASSSRQTFASPAEKDQFFAKWTAYYLESCQKSSFVALDEGGKVLGYLMGCESSEKASGYYREVNPSYALFEDQFKRFPAHLHINCAPDARGLGCGSLLIAHFIKQLRSDGVQGVHIVTSPDADNRHFYGKNGFNFELIRAWKERPLLFMGRDL